MAFSWRCDSPAGTVFMASDGGSLTGLWFAGQKYFPEELGEKRSLPVFRLTEKWLSIYFSGSEPDFFPAIRLTGTPFQMEVWEILRTIPYGKTVTYGDIARNIAQRRGIARMSAQAVGGAVGRNPVSVIVPCHRVVGSDGSLTGYAGGTEIKKFLLELEGQISKSTTPESR